MDADRFDAWTRRLSSRRTALATLAGGLAVLGAWLDPGGAKAAKCKPSQKRCRGKCIPKRRCCTNANCGPRRVCTKRGSCVCAAPYKPCAGDCIPDGDCCTNANCGTGRICDGGSCVCDVAGGFKACGDDCIPESGCCTTAECDAGDICAEHQCVTGQGTCPVGEDVCVDWLPPFNCGNSETLCACVQTMSGETRCGGSVQGATCGECTSDGDCAGRGPGAFCGKTTDAGGPVCTCNLGQGFCVLPCAV